MCCSLRSELLEEEELVAMIDTRNFGPGSSLSVMLNGDRRVLEVTSALTLGEWRKSGGEWRLTSEERRAYELEDDTWYLVQVGEDWYLFNQWHSISQLELGDITNAAKVWDQARDKPNPPETSFILWSDPWIIRRVGRTEVISIAGLSVQASIEDITDWILATEPDGDGVIYIESPEGTSSAWAWIGRKLEFDMLLSTTAPVH